MEKYTYQDQSKRIKCSLIVALEREAEVIKVSKLSNKEYKKIPDLETEFLN